MGLLYCQQIHISTKTFPPNIDKATVHLKIMRTLSVSFTEPLIGASMTVKTNRIVQNHPSTASSNHVNSSRPLLSQTNIRTKTKLCNISFYPRN